MKLDSGNISVCKWYTTRQRKNILAFISAGHSLDAKFAGVEAVAKAKQKSIDKALNLLKDNKQLLRMPIASLLKQAGNIFTPLSDKTFRGRRLINKALRKAGDSTTIEGNYMQVAGELSNDGLFGGGLKDRIGNSVNNAKLKLLALREQLKPSTIKDNIASKFTVGKESVVEGANKAKTSVEDAYERARNGIKGIFKRKKGQIKESDGEVTDEKTEEKKSIAQHLIETKSTLGRLLYKLFGKKKKKEDTPDEKKGFFTGVKKTLSKACGWFKSGLGWIAAIAASVLGIAGLGHTTNWWRFGGGQQAVGGVWDKVKQAVMGKKNENGFLEGGLRGILFGNKNANGNLIGGLRGILFGSRNSNEEDFSGGIFSGVTNTFMNFYDRVFKPTVDKVKNFFAPVVNGVKTLPEWLKDDVWGYYKDDNNKKGMWSWISYRFSYIGRDIKDGWNDPNGIPKTWKFFRIEYLVPSGRIKVYPTFKVLGKIVYYYCKIGNPSK